MTTPEPIVQQLDSLIGRYERAAPDYSNSPNERWSLRDLHGLASSAMAAIGRLSLPGSPYSRRADEIMNEDRYLGDKVEGLIGIVDALRHDYESGALAPLRELIRAEVFEDFLEMAEHLLESGYKDSAAVMIGGVLEGELRKLAQRAGVSTASPDGRPIKAEALNGSLAGKDVYNKLDQKSVTSWLDLRNKAAHAHYDEYTVDQVRVMLMGVRNFISRVSSSAV